MEIIKGRIEEKKVSDGTNAQGKPWTRITYKINGKYFSTFDAVDFDEGATVQLSYVVNGKYNNIKSGVLVTEGVASPPMPVTEEFIGNPSGLKVRVIEGNEAIVFETLLNTFNEEHDVRFTQTHVSVVGNGSSIQLLYTAVLFYKD